MHLKRRPIQLLLCTSLALHARANHVMSGIPTKIGLSRLLPQATPPAENMDDRNGDLLEQEVHGYTGR